MVCACRLHTQRRAADAPAVLVNNPLLPLLAGTAASAPLPADIAHASLSPATSAATTVPAKAMSMGEHSLLPSCNICIADED